MSSVEQISRIWLPLGYALIAACSGSDAATAPSNPDASAAGGQPGQAAKVAVAAAGSGMVAMASTGSLGSMSAGPAGASGASGSTTTSAAMPGNAAANSGSTTTSAGAATATGAAGAAGTVAPITAAAAGSGAGMMASGMCCPTGDCLCHGDVPSALTSEMGHFKTATLRVATGNVHYPTDAEPPFAAVAVCGGFLNTGPEMETWGDFYASYGIVTIITTTGAADPPDTRGDKLIAAVKSLQEENMKSDSPLSGKLSDRYGTSGYSMGGGGTTIATSKDASLSTSVGMAPFGGTGMNVKTATLLLCGSADTTAPCNMATSVYMGIADPTPKMLVVLAGTSHLEWVGSYMTAGGAAAKIALAFQKVFLEGDVRWKPLLKSMVMGVQSSMSANID